MMKRIVMDRTIWGLILAVALSVVAPVTVKAYDPIMDDPMMAEIFAELQQQEQNAKIARQNKIAYDATATKLQKKVDSLIAKYEANCENEAKAQKYLDELLKLYNTTPAEEWKVNYTLPSGYSEYLPNTIMIKVGYNFSDERIAEGDLRTWMWYFENGVFYRISANGYADNIRWGSSSARINWLMNHPTSGSITLPSGEVYSGVGAE